MKRQEGFWIQMIETSSDKSLGASPDQPAMTEEAAKGWAKYMNENHDSSGEWQVFKLGEVSFVSDKAPPFNYPQE